MLIWVAISELSIPPWTLLVERVSARTDPDLCAVALPLSETRSAKVVSLRLNPVVCEFAIFPEMLSSA
jgi:hypothetical protein